MSSSYYLNQQPITTHYQDLWIANWDNQQNSSRGFGTQGIASSKLRAICAAQRGETAAALFDNNFINYTQGYLLCTNTRTVLNSIGNIDYASNSVLGSLVFTVVRMPAEFISNEASLSSKYEYGEQLRVFFSYEVSSLVSQDPTIIPATYFSSIPQGVSRQTIVARDANIKGRGIKGASTGGGIGIGIWS